MSTAQNQKMIFPHQYLNHGPQEPQASVVPMSYAKIKEGFLVSNKNIGLCLCRTAARQSEEIKEC